MKITYARLNVGTYLVKIEGAEGVQSHPSQDQHEFLRNLKEKYPDAAVQEVTKMELMESSYGSK
jgi:hypothetical protein